MSKIIYALAALVACAICTPAALAGCDIDDAEDLRECLRAKALGARQFIPSVPRPSAAARAKCDPDEVDDVARCLRGLRPPGVRQGMPSEIRPAVEPKQHKTVVGSKPEPVETTPAVAEKSGKLDGPDERPLCKKYSPNIGQMITVPCGN